MSNAKTICPECGKVNTHAINGNADEFLDSKTTCACGHEYENFPNTSLSVPQAEVSATSNS